MMEWLFYIIFPVCALLHCLIARHVLSTHQKILHEQLSLWKSLDSLQEKIKVIGNDQIKIGSSLNIQIDRLDSRIDLKQDKIPQNDRYTDLKSEN